MKASELLEEIKEDMRNFNTKPMKENLKKEDINRLSKQLAKFNLENYYEILSKNIPEEEDFDIEDSKIAEIRNEIKLFF
ncbi:MAG: hypothetical protein IKS93_05935, partial [Methanobrevibacter sp.]|nr:hypothetical protein [Methanobrevibacter sp.]